jgi:hypothetical protein
LKRICFYTSDHGYGHAARDIAIIRGICKQLDVRVYVKTDVPFEFMKHSLPFAQVIRRRNDIGIHERRVFRGQCSKDGPDGG